MNHREDLHSPTETDGEPDESFVQRWSRRKREADKTPEAAPPIAAESAEPAGAPEPQPEPEPPGDEDMPPLDSLGPGSDVSVFFSPRVSEGLRQAALQRLFRQPQFNYQDGLDVYCGNYRHFKPLGDIVTAAMRHRIEAAKARLAQLTEQVDPDGMNTATDDTASADVPNDTTKPIADPLDNRIADQSTDPANDPTNDPTNGNNGHA